LRPCSPVSVAAVRRIVELHFPGKDEHVVVFRYIEGWYTPRRLHSAIGFLSLVDFERHHAGQAVCPTP